MPTYSVFMDNAVKNLQDYHLIKQEGHPLKVFGSSPRFYSTDTRQGWTFCFEKKQQLILESSSYWTTKKSIRAYSGFSKNIWKAEGRGFPPSSTFFKLSLPSRRSVHLISLRWGQRMFSCSNIRNTGKLLGFVVIFKIFFSSHRMLFFIDLKAI